MYEQVFWSVHGLSFIFKGEVTDGEEGVSFVHEKVVCLQVCMTTYICSCTNMFSNFL